MSDKSKQGRRNRQKGAELERELVHELRDAGIDAKRIEGSGMQASGHNDVIAQTRLGTLEFECKRKKRFAGLYDWVSNADVAVVRGDRQEALAIIPLKKYVELIK